MKYNGGSSLKKSSKVIKIGLIILLVLAVVFAVLVIYKSSYKRKIVGDWKSTQVDLMKSRTDENGNTEKAGEYENTLIQYSILIFTRDGNVYLDSEEYKYEWVDKNHIIIRKSPYEEKLEVKFKENKLLLSCRYEDRNIDYEIQYEKLKTGCTFK